MQQRYYDPGIGRFLSVDPVTANGNTGGNFNRYWYANNNPYRFTDPDGRYTCGASDAQCALVDRWVQKLQQSRRGLKPNSKGYKAVDRVINQIGKKGDSEHGPRYVAARLEGLTVAATDQNGTTSIDFGKMTSDQEGAKAVGHEADHDRYVNEHGPVSDRAGFTQTETEAYQVTAAVAQGFGEYLPSADIKQGIEDSVNRDMNDLEKKREKASQTSEVGQ